MPAPWDNTSYSTMYKYMKCIKETSFMYAVSSAGLVHEFARACAQGIMDKCTCDESKHLENTKTWLWGGCGDNIRFGLKFTRKFLRRSRRLEKDIRAQVDDHNSGAGIKVSFLQLSPENWY
ncbi:protein Wnt [Elysia marginata]|uniref:Protein Wnt n=1 Tax=Elysia marginata TaxID=1093978 RepID=A0AAV4I357_9GAST|nr:protein Wnt [Elysia marginata]